MVIQFNPACLTPARGRPGPVMALFVVVNNPMRRRIAILVSLLAAFLLTRMGLWISDAAYPVTARPGPLRVVPMAENRVALTFNVLWGEENPARILDILKQQGARATFFLPGPWAQAHPDLVKRMLAEGHEIGSYGQKPIDLSRYPREVVREEIEMSLKVLSDLIGQRPRFFRPPNGRYNDAVLEAAAEFGVTVAHWGTDSQDWATPGPDLVIRRGLSAAKPGNIIRLTASDSVPDTPEALAAIIQGLRQKGFETVPLSDLIAGSSS